MTETTHHPAALHAYFGYRDGYQRPPRKGDTMGFGTYLCVADAADVDAIHARALDAGTTGVWAPGNTEWGNYRCRVLDLEGFEWTFGTHRPGEPQEDRSEGE